MNIVLTIISAMFLVLSVFNFLLMFSIDLYITHNVNSMKKQFKSISLLFILVLASTIITVFSFVTISILVNLLLIMLELAFFVYVQRFIDFNLTYYLTDFKKSRNFQKYVKNVYNNPSFYNEFEEFKIELVCNKYKAYYKDVILAYINIEDKTYEDFFRITINKDNYTLVNNEVGDDLKKRVLELSGFSRETFESKVALMNNENLTSSV